MDYTITIPDELTAGIVAVSYLEGVTPEQVVAAHAISAATKICQDMKVGPYYEGPTPPQFNPDGTPYSPDWAPPVVEAGVIKPPVDAEPAPQVA